MPVIPKPPISADVADVIGAWAERVDNRSLLMDKFVLHKSWPVVRSEINGDTIKMDDASRWSFIRMTQDGGEYLQREQKNLSRKNGEKERVKEEVVEKLKDCACRKLSPELVEQKLEQSQWFAEVLSQHGAVVVYGELGGRLAINLSDGLIQNAGICLDRHTGLPYIPGAAVKGVTRHVALEHLRAGDLSLADFKVIFGTVDADFKADGKSPGELSSYSNLVPKAERTQKGGVDFLAAYPVDREPRITVDISNVHRPDYYASGDIQDLKKETPRPNTFPTVEIGARFAFCIVPNALAISTELLARVRAFLVEAITIQGIGGKTAAGYGWFKDVTTEIETAARLVREQAAMAREKAAIAAEMAEKEAAQRAERERKAALSPCERILEEWSKSTLKGIVNGIKFVRFDRLEKAEQMAIVESLRVEGVGTEVWALLKAEESNPKRKIKHAPVTVGAIRRFIKSEKLEKLS